MPTPYLPGGNLSALESSPFPAWGDPALANAANTSAQAAGSDPAAHAATAMKTGPEVVPSGSGDLVSAVLDFVNPLSTKAEKATASAQIDVSSKTILYSAILVVLALLLFSRGLGMIGEEGAGVVADLGDPTKYPGIGHAVRGIKGK